MELEQGPIDEMVNKNSFDIIRERKRAYLIESILPYLLVVVIYLGMDFLDFINVIDHLGTFLFILLVPHLLFMMMNLNVFLITKDYSISNIIGNRVVALFVPLIGLFFMVALGYGTTDSNMVFTLPYALAYIGVVVINSLRLINNK